MKLLFASVAALCVAVAVAQIGSYRKDGITGAEYNAAAIGNHQNGAYGQAAGRYDYGKYGNQDNYYGNAGRQGYAKKNAYDQAAGSAAAKSGHTNDYYNNQAAAQRENAVRGGDAAYRQSHYNDANAHSAYKNNANKAGYNNNYANKNQYNKAHVLTDSIHYGFDKKFDKDADESGVYEVSNHKDAHKLDDYRDKSRYYDTKQGYHANAAKKSDLAHAVKESKYNKAAASKSASGLDYANKANKVNKAGQHSNLHHLAKDVSAGKNKYTDSAKDASVRKYNDYAAKDAAYGRQGAAANSGAQAGAYAKSGRQYAPKYGYNRGVGIGHGLGQAAKNNAYYGAQAKHLEGAANSASKKNGKFGAAEDQYYKDHDSAAYAKHDNLRDHEQGNYKSGLYSAQDGGHNNAAKSAAASQGAASRQYADAASRYANSAANSDKYAAARAAENAKRNLHDSNSNSKTVKKFHTSKKVGGNNYERLNFDRKRLDRDYANNAAYKAANANKYNNDLYNANAKNNKYNDAAAAARQAHDAYYHNNAAAAQKAAAAHDTAAAQRSAARKAAYNNDAAANAYNQYKDNRARTANAAHNNADQYYGKRAAAHDNAAQGAEGVKYTSNKAPRVAVTAGLGLGRGVGALGYNYGYPAENNYQGYQGNNYGYQGYPGYNYGYNGYNNGLRGNNYYGSYPYGNQYYH